MADVRCPNCGLVSRIPDGTPANCVRCGAQLLTAFSEGNAQFLGQPAPQTPQPSAMPFPQTQSAAPVQPVHAPETLKLAKKKRRDWRILNAVMYAVQSVALALGVYLHENDSDAFIFPMLGWIGSLLGFSVLSAMLRPDAAYLEKPPFCRKKGLYFFIHLLLSLTTFLSAAIVYAIISMLFE